MTDCLIVGGGVVGLSLAYELAGHGRDVHLIDAGQPGREASWAGAGILPPASANSDDPLQQLTALSNRVHRQWAEELRTQTGIDNGYLRCGAIYLARGIAERERLDLFADLAQSLEIMAERIATETLADLEEELRPSGPLERAYLVPDECQLRNPRHLRALVAACQARGVKITAGAAAEEFEIRGGRVRSVRTSQGNFVAEQVCLTSGAWSGALARRLGINPAIKPIRGQIVLLALAHPRLRRIVNEGRRYLVPRADGRILVGSTEEDVGFDRDTTAGAIEELLAFALSLAPGLKDARLERAWAGLRPSTQDGLPYIGRVGDLENAFMAAGHYRGGLQLSTGTAVVLGQSMQGQRPQVDLNIFDPGRKPAESSPAAAAQPVRRHVPAV